MGFEVQKDFSYDDISDEGDRNFLKGCQAELGLNERDFAMKQGAVFKKAHDFMAKHRYGNFYGWCKFTGYSPASVQNYLHYHDLLSTHVRQ